MQWVKTEARCQPVSRSAWRKGVAAVGTANGTVPCPVTRAPSGAALLQPHEADRSAQHRPMAEPAKNCCLVATSKSKKKRVRFEWILFNQLFQKLYHSSM